VSCRSCKRDRFRQPPQTPKHSRIVLQYSRVVWVEFERLGEIRLRASPIPLPGCAPHPTCRITPRLVWCQRDRPLGRGRSSLKSRGIICYVRKKRLRKGEARVGRGVVRIERNGAAIGVNGGAEITEAVSRKTLLPQQVLKVGVCVRGAAWRGLLAG